MKFGWPPTQFVRVSSYEIGYSWELQLHDLKPWLFWLIVLNCQDMLCKFIVKFDKMKQMWLNYYETNRNYEEKNVIHVQCSYCPTCSVPKWRNANGWTWGSLWLKMSYSSSFGWLFGLFLFRYWTWRGGGKKNPAKKPVQRSGRYFSIQMSKRLLFRVFGNA